jgi:signal transduction histidine kinase
MSYSRKALDKGDYIGFTAFGAVVLGSFSTFAFNSRIDGEPWQLILTFVLGGVFATLGIISNRLVDEKKPVQCWVYFLVQATMGLGCIWISPEKGFFGILCLPLASQTVFHFRWPVAIALSLVLYIGTASVFYPQWGWLGVKRGLLSYSTAYIFTVGFTFVTFDAVRERIRSTTLATDLETANTQLRAHSEQAEELATTRERNRLAREIHDGVGHYLTVINIQLEAARAVFSSDSAKARLAVEKAARLSKEALEDVRRSVGSLRTEATRVALPEALRQLTTDAGLTIEYTVEGDSRPLPSNVEHALFRATQEGLTNVRKHAQTDHVQVRLDFRDLHQVKLSISDDGQGLNGVIPASGFGLKGMHERVGLLGGTVNAGARPAGGFQLSIEVPV